MEARSLLSKVVESNDKNVGYTCLHVYQVVQYTWKWLMV